MATKAKTSEVKANQTVTDVLEQEKNNFEKMVKDSNPITDKSDLEQKLAYTMNKAEMDIQKLKYPIMTSEFEQMNIKLRRDDAWSYL